MVLSKWFGSPSCATLKHNVETSLILIVSRAASSPNFLRKITDELVAATMVPSKNLEMLISILFALRGVLGADGADSTAALDLGGVVDETSSANAGSGALTTASPGDLATVTIFDTPAYSVAVGCVRECLMQEFEPGVPDGLILAAALGCTR